MLPNPEAYAISLKPRSVVSMSVRALRARWSSAIASGPAPSSAVRTRWSWRTL